MVRNCPQLTLNNLKKNFSKGPDTNQNLNMNSFGKEDMIHIKRKILKVVESLLEEKVTAEKLIESCQILTKDDYADVVEERNITGLCGYPLCSHCVQIPSQNFRIMSKVNRVYDIKERKGFCSNECYKASCYLKHQLSEIAVWFQEDPVVLTLLSDQDNSGSIGELIPLSPDKLLDTDENLKYKSKDWVAEVDKKLMQDELSKCADHFKDLKVTEKSGPATYADDEGSKLKDAKVKCDFSLTSQHNILAKISEASDEVSSTESDCSSDDEYFLSEENKNVSEKLMPLLPTYEAKPLVLIDPNNKSVIELSSVTSKLISLCTVQDILRDWFTCATLEFLNDKLDHDDTQSVQGHADLPSKEDAHKRMDDNDTWTCDKLEETATELQNATNNHEATQSEQTELAKITALQIEMVKQYFQGESLLPGKRKQIGAVKFKTGRKGNVRVMKNRTLGMATKKISPMETEGKHDSEGTASKDFLLPKVDSFSQSALRQQVVCSKLKNAFSGILPVIGLHYTLFGEIILHLVSTFRLTASNVMCRPKEWTVLAVILFRVMTKGCIMKDKISERYMEDDAFSTILKETDICKHLSLQDIDKAITELFYWNSQFVKSKS